MISPAELEVAGALVVAPLANGAPYFDASGVPATYSLTAGGRALAGAAGTANTFPYFSAANTVSLGALTAFARSLLDDADYITARATLQLTPGVHVQAQDAGLQSIAGLTTAADQGLYSTGPDVYATYNLTAFARTLLDDADQATMRATLGLVPGTDIQAFDAGLLSIAGLTTAANQALYTTAPDVYATYSLTAAGRALVGGAGAADTFLYFSALNVASSTALTAFARTLLDDANQGQARATLGLAIGADVQAFSANLTALSAKTAPAGALIGSTDAQTLTNKTFDAASNSLTNLATSMFAAGVIDTDGTMSANSDARLPTQAAVRAFVLSQASANDKAAVRVASTANLTLSGTQTIDGVAVVASDRVLAKNQTTAAQNGIWIVAAGAWARAGDLDEASEFPRATCLVLEGGQAATKWTCNNSAVVVGSTAIVFVQSYAQVSYTAGAGLGLIGSQFAITDPELLAIAGVTSAANKLFYFTGAGTGATADLTPFARSLLDDADAATARTTLGVLMGAFGAPVTIGGGAGSPDLGAQSSHYIVLSGSQVAIDSFGSSASTNDPFYFVRFSTAHTLNASANLILPGGATFGTVSGDCALVVYEGAGVWRIVLYFDGAKTAFSRVLAKAVDAAAARTTLGVQIGTNVLAYSALLQGIAGVTFVAGQGLYATGPTSFAAYNLTAGGRALGAVAGTADTFPYFSALNVAGNAPLTAAGRALLDDADAAAQRLTLGVAPSEIYPIGTIADDGVAVVPLNTTGAMVMLVPDNAGPAARALLWARTVATLGIQALASAGVTVGLYTTALTGTTGVDGQVNVGASGGNLYVENRSGAARNYRLFIFRYDS